MSGKAALKVATDEAYRASAELLDRELERARKVEAEAWDAFYASLDGRDLRAMRSLMGCYLRAAEERAQIAESVGAASEEMERRAALRVRLSDRYKGLRPERFTIDK